MSDGRHTDPILNGVSSLERPLRFALLYRGHRFELRPGTLVMGRGTACQLVLDDALVSRKHAEIEVSDRAATLVDLGSVNGVFVNGARIDGRQGLNHGDKLLIGQQEITLLAGQAPSVLPESPTGRLSAETLVGIESPIAPGARPVDESEPTHQGDALALLGGVVDKVLALGRGDEAERIIGPYLKNYLATVQRTQATTPEAADKAVGYAMKLASATRKGDWVDYAFALYMVCQRPLPGAVVDQLYTLMRQVSSVNLSLLREYLGVLQAVSTRLGPNERFLAQRIEGLERLASA